MDNKVIGNKAHSNVDPKNMQRVTGGQTQMGKISGNQKPLVLRTQNSANHTPGGPDEKGDEGVKVQTKRQKKIIRSGASYDDKAIKAASNARGMHAPA